MFFKSVEIGPGIPARSLRVKKEVFSNEGQIKLDKRANLERSLGLNVLNRFIADKIIDRKDLIIDIPSFNAFLETDIDFLKANLPLRSEEHPNSIIIQQALGRIIEKTPDNFESIYDIRLYNSERNNEVIYDSHHDDVMDAVRFLLKGDVHEWNNYKNEFDANNIRINLSGIHLAGARHSYMVLRDINFSGVDASLSHISYVLFTRGNLNYVNFRRSVQMDVDLSLTELESGDFIGAKLIQVDMVYPNIRNAFFIDTTFVDTELHHPEKEEAIFEAFAH